MLPTPHPTFMQEDCSGTRRAWERSLVVPPSAKNAQPRLELHPRPFIRRQLHHPSPRFVERTGDEHERFLAHLLLQGVMQHAMDTREHSRHDQLSCDHSRTTHPSYRRLLLRLLQLGGAARHLIHEIVEERHGSPASLPTDPVVNTPRKSRLWSCTWGGNSPTLISSPRARLSTPRGNVYLDYAYLDKCCQQLRAIWVAWGMHKYAYPATGMDSALTPACMFHASQRHGCPG